MHPARLPDLRDPETGAHGPSFFGEYAAKEVQRAQRYGRSFALVLLRVDALPMLQKTLGAEAARSLLRGIAGAVGRVARDVDVVARLSDDELVVLLPETDHFGALMFQRRALAAAEEDLASRGIAGAQVVALEPGAATHGRDGRDVDSLLHRCRERSRLGRLSPAVELRKRNLDFWQSVDHVLDPGGPEDPSSRRLAMSPSLFRSIRAEILREVAREGEGRGLVFSTSGPKEHADWLPLLEALPRGAGSWGVHLFGRRGPSALVHPALTPVYVDAEDPCCRHELLLFLSEQSSYALVRRDDLAFHTSDPPLVDSLVTRLQRTYDLHTF
ncbi:GGDEF domain-containing protein [Vulgatibacter incomptus]|uniref:Response regulator/GGDEF domain protein n=1 Tax=Vulgatibacter incomptus TaxID=1391653 RepID=A0A0K1PEF6_9BACT|nr:GGDEF domain-containing protein [Vulgatibacter incomptus]AKU91918.1 response regulator/GGDEF domain protein [Vulgatibacter incomptus]